jgi:site-specific DNA-methyltransferase (adenine-specific)
MEEINLIHGDCLEKLQDIPDKSIDMVLTDPPYGTTRNKWDSVINFESMWNELKRIIKDNGAICLFGQQPFSSAVVMSNPKMFKYEWIWKKPMGTGFLNAKKYPLKDHENILVFCKKPHVYNPQFGKGKPYKTKRGGLSSNYGKAELTITVNDGKRYPKTTLEFNHPKKKIHPTQKPVELLEYLVKTYSNKGETVLDFTMGSGSTGVACKNLNRKFIGIEKDLKYFEISKERIEKLSSYEDLYPNG